LATSERALTIGQLAARTGSNAQIIRYYEQTGLMPAPARTDGNQRRYGKDHVRRLAFIRNARELGFGIEAIETLLDLADNPDRSCQEVIAIAEDNLAGVRSRIGRLRALERELKRLIASCSGGRIGDCRIIEALSDPRR
jgi:DNA-binding transcriptional MerR regulator